MPFPVLLNCILTDSSICYSFELNKIFHHNLKDGWMLCSVTLLVHVHNNGFYDSKIRNTIKYHTWPRTQHGKVTKTQENITYNRAKRLARFQQVITRLQWTDKKARQTWNINNKNDPQKKHRFGTVSRK